MVAIAARPAPGVMEQIVSVAIGNTLVILLHDFVSEFPLGIVCYLFSWLPAFCWQTALACIALFQICLKVRASAQVFPLGSKPEPLDLIVLRNGGVDEFRPSRRFGIRCEACMPFVYFPF